MGENRSLSHPLDLYVSLLTLSLSLSSSRKRIVVSLPVVSSFDPLGSTERTAK